MMILILVGIVGILFLYSKYSTATIQKKKKKKRNKKSKTLQVDETEKYVGTDDMSPADDILPDDGKSAVEEISTTNYIDRGDYDVQNSSKKSHAILVIKSSKSSTKSEDFQVKRRNVENNVLTKKQRQNLRKKELEKSIKNENDSVQKQRLEKYRREQEREALKRLMK